VSDWQLEYYQTASGRCPVREYVDALDDDEAARVTFDLDLLAEFGLDLRAPYVRSLGAKLWELRTHGRVQHRVLHFAATGRRLVVVARVHKEDSADTTPRNRNSATSSRRLPGKDGPMKHQQYVAEREARDPGFKAARDALRPQYEFQRALIAARLTRGLTQEDLAARLGTTQSAIARLERGTYRPRVETLHQLAEILDVEFAITPEVPLAVRPRRRSGTRRRVGLAATG
jgi:ribosome-binding protein aMBF1 (putative translation factor)